MGSPTPIALRAAVAADVPAVVALVEGAYRGVTSRAGWSTEADLLSGRRTDAEEVRALVDAPRSRLLLHDAAAVSGEGEGEGGEGLRACCAVADRGAGLAHLGMFAVAPTAQGAGTGRRVLAAAEAVAVRELGARDVEMTVLVHRTELLAWYGRRGYAATGERRPFPYGDERFGIPLRDDLEFVVLRRAVDPG